MSLNKPKPKPFLTAEWRYLVMLNYPVEQALLEPHVPAGTLLDTYQGNAYVSVVGFLFLKTRVMGFSVPFHQNFEEVNLRFYVRRFSGEDWRRGVVFIKEIVPKLAIATIARKLYNENYVALPMSHKLETTHDRISLEYGWRLNERWNFLRAQAVGVPVAARPGSLEEFITEHYWGYVAQKDGVCVEYQVEHPRWQIWRAEETAFDCDVAELYGEKFAGSLAVAPSSAFIAEGSPVTVYRGVKLPR